MSEDIQKRLADAKKFLDVNNPSVAERIEKRYKIISELESLSASWISGSPPAFAEKLRQLEQAMGQIGQQLEASIHSGEHELLPVLVSYAAEIMAVGLPYEHQKMLHQASQIRERARELAGRKLERQEQLGEEGNIRDSIDKLLGMMQEHSQTLDSIRQLAKDMLAKETGQDF